MSKFSGQILAMLITVNSIIILLCICAMHISLSKQIDSHMTDLYMNNVSLNRHMYYTSDVSVRALHHLSPAHKVVDGKCQILGCPYNSGKPEPSIFELQKEANKF